MWGILIQLPSNLKKNEIKKLDDLFQLIKLLEGRMHQSPSASLHEDLLAARLALRQQLMSEFETQLKKNPKSLTIGS